MCFNQREKIVIKFVIKGIYKHKVIIFIVIESYITVHALSIKFTSEEKREDSWEQRYICLPSSILTYRYQILIVKHPIHFYFQNTEK